MPETLQKWLDTLIEQAPTLGAAIVIFLAGWIVAIVAAAIVRKLLTKTLLDDQLGKFISGEGKDPVKVDVWLATAVKWLILLFTITLVVDKLGMQQATEPLNALLTKVTGYLPNVLGAALLMFIGWVVARVVRMAVVKGLGVLEVDERLNASTGDDAEDVEVSVGVGNAAYWVILLLFLVLVLDNLELAGLVDPLKGMLDKALAFVPNLFSAALIGLVGWFLATIVRRILTAVLAAVGVDRGAQKLGMPAEGKTSLSGLLGTVAFVLILLNVLVAALEALSLEAVSGPVTGLLRTFYDAIPNLLYATVIVLVAVLIGRLLSSLVTDLLARLGFDNIFRALGLPGPDAESTEPSRRPAAIVGHIVFLAVVLIGGMEALDKLDLASVSDMVNEFLVLAGGWVLGLLIFGLGLWLANLVAGIIKDRETPSSHLLATAARVGISTLAAIAALDHMGVAEEVVKWATVAAVAAVGLGAALAFGLGCQSQAAEQMKRWRGKLEPGGSDDPTDETA